MAAANLALRFLLELAGQQRLAVGFAIAIVVNQLLLLVLRGGEA